MTWICNWCQIYGIFPLEKAERPDSEEPVMTADGKDICTTCAEKYWKAKEEADRLNALEKARSMRQEN